MDFGDFLKNAGSPVPSLPKRPFGNDPMAQKASSLFGASIGIMKKLGNKNEASSTPVKDGIIYIYIYIYVYIYIYIYL